MNIIKQLALQAIFKKLYEYRDGVVYRRKNGTVVKKYKVNGYLQYHFSLGHQEMLHVSEHCMKYVLEYGLYDPKYVIAHKNHDRADNHIDNLECITQRQNVMDSMHYKAEHPMKGKTFERIIYPPNIRQKVKELRDEGMSYVDIGKHFNMTRQTASKIYDEEEQSMPYHTKKD